ncbi:unnamed protein product [Hymenolepis diminuta]|uniref:Uncharacterized protein n=1 Tax=Hymenolepis diminuta TaxID=6216 RepID=A0A564ZC57_HYMDI|nr:unnamed protein product [Hymenolepis diminuta]
MTHDPYLPCLNATTDFPLSITASFHLKSTFNKNSRVSATGSYASCSSPLFLSTLSSLPLSLARFNP